MATYKRLTATPIRDVLRIADEVMLARLPLEKVEETRHSVTFRGEDGTMRVDAHRHGMETEVVVTTDQFRTSRIDLETQHFLDKLPYQPGDVPTR